ncbi:cilia- and flagella-associated protein 337 [Genypterus blacodes]|uniref:cilia- and flagella-associated protein 337 n=1 Tax=Genypterus blacodes TaxID=154954 RepID=UPI003F764F26
MYSVKITDKTQLPSILSELRSGAGFQGEPLAEESLGDSQDSKEQPDWMLKELLKQNRLRHSVTFGDEAELATKVYHSAGSNPSLKIDEKVSVDDLQKLKLAFEEYEEDGLSSVDERNFGRIVKKCLNTPNTRNAQIQALFRKIDYAGRGRISWEEFCTYILLEHREKEDCLRRSKQVAFTLPATIKPSCHGVPIQNIQSSLGDTIVTVQVDGTVCYWSPELKPQKTKSLFDEGPGNRKSKWASDFKVMTEYNKLVIATGDREIQLYELSTLEPFCQISALETVPLTLDYWVVMCKNGRLWNKSPKIENTPTITIDSAVVCPNVVFVQWKIHQDWVTQVKYFPSFRAVVSSSNEDASSLVMGCLLPLTNVDQQLREIKEACYEGKTKKIQLSWTPQHRASRDQTVFSNYKGVKTFDLSEKHSLLVTGGLDRLIRMWNPYFPGKPTGILKGHAAPIFYLCISSDDNQIFSVSTDNTVKIWDIQDECCLYTAPPKASGIHGDLSACLYSPDVKNLYIAADSMAVLSLKVKGLRSGLMTVSHNEPVMCCGFSKEFRQVVSCSEGSVVKVWDFDTGSPVFEFGVAHGSSAITCMTFDPKGRRLITGGQDGCLKIWNFNNGQCLKTLKRDGECQEVCDCAYVEVHRNSYVMCVGWERKIDVYLDAPADHRHVQRPQPSWQDDLVNGHKDDILCIAQCPPTLLATSSYDGEIIVWNAVSGHTQCRFGLDTSIPSIVFLKKPKLQQFPSATILLSSGVKGCVNLWNVHAGGKFVSSFKASRFQQKIIKMAKGGGDTLLYAADHIGYIHVYNTEKFTLKPQPKQPRAEYMWRAHTNKVTGLQIVDSDQVVLTSSTDGTVRLWSACGEFVGTFGQSERWNVHISSSWMHPAVPYEVLIDPLSMPVHKFLNAKSRLTDSTDPDGAEIDRRGAKSEETRGEQRLPLPSIRDTDVEENEIFCRESFQQTNELLNHCSLKSVDNGDPPMHPS